MLDSRQRIIGNRADNEEISALLKRNEISSDFEIGSSQLTNVYDDEGTECKAGKLFIKLIFK